MGAERPGVRVITLARPEKANALSAGLVEALIAQLEEAHAAGASVIAFRGEGRNLSAGFDFGGYQDLSEEALVQRFVRIETLLQAIARSPALTIGFAHGRNFGAGVDLLAACKWRVAAPEATFRMPGLAFGLVLGTRRFAAIVGRERARSLLESMGTFDAETALEMGFATAVCAPEMWDVVLDTAVATVAKLGPGREALYRALAPATDAEDMRDLVGSASVPGLKERIAKYLAG